MKKLKKSIRVDDVEVIDTSLIYSRVIALQLINDALKVENVFQHELSPIPTSMFDDIGNMRSAKTKSSLNKLGVKVSSRSMTKPSLLVVDGCAILWVINWPTNGKLSDYVGNFCDFIFLHLQSNDTSVVFDKYYDFSVESSTRADRCKFSSQTHMMTLTSPLPPKSSVLTSASCKVQIIKHVTEGLLLRAVAGCYGNSLVITGLSETSTEVSHGVAIQRQDLRTFHEEADLIMVQQAHKAV